MSVEIEVKKTDESQTKLMAILIRQNMRLQDEVAALRSILAKLGVTPPEVLEN